MLQGVEAIVIKTQNYGETHKIITVFTKQLGKITALSRGANRPKSRLSAISQPFIAAELLLYVRSGLSTVQQGSLIESFRKIREDIEKTAYTAFIIELTDKTLQTREPDPFIYNELLQTLTWINDKEEYMVPVMMYELKMFAKAGISPVLHQCVSCSCQDVPFVFSVQEGGLLCDACRALDEHAFVLGPAVLRILPVLQSASLQQVGSISVQDKNIHTLRLILDQYYDRFGGYKLKSKRFIDQLNELK